MDPFKRWAGQGYSRKERLIAVLLGGFVFWVAVPLLILEGSSYMDTLLQLSRYHYGSINVWVGLLCMILGWLFANWTVKVQFTIGKGTPIPLMATQKLVVKGPYIYCRNPMTLGTAVFYLGVAIWLGSLSAL